MKNNPYFKEKKAGHKHKVRLFCFPYAGGNSSIYNDWSQELHKDISLITLQLKGRMERIAEDAVNNMDTLVDELYNYIKPYLFEPFAFYGHSLGGLVSFALLQKIEQNGFTAKAIFIAATKPPHAYLDSKMNDYSDETLTNKLKEYKNTPDYVLESKELMELILPTIRADYQLLDSYNIKKEKNTISKLVLFNCEDDIKKKVNLEWSEYFKNDYIYRSFEDGHFFLNTQRSKIINYINQVLS